MDTMDKTQRFSRTIPCANCGEEYSITYKKCPFCGGSASKKAERASKQKAEPQMEVVEYNIEDNWSDPSETMSQTGKIKAGKRLKKEKKGGGMKVLMFFISLAIVVAAAYIVVTKVVPLVQTYLGDKEGTSQGTNVDPTNPDAGKNQIVAPTGFRLLDVNVTLTTAGETKQLEAVVDSEKTTETLTWSSSDSEIVDVSNEGKLTAVSPGTAIITVTRENGDKAQCEVQCIWEAGASNANLLLNKDDYTLRKGETFTMKVIGTEETPQWSIENPKVATISEKGVVKPVGNGNTIITAQVAGQTLTCIVRCKI